MKKKRWKLLWADDQKIKSLQDSLGIHPVICKILVERGIDDYAKAKSFFRPSMEELHSPWLMKDMERAVDRILRALEKKEKILVFGDYDVDGTTAVATMFQFLQKIGDPNLLDFYIPHRYREGYGISRAGIQFAIENNFSLVISLDCGIKSVDLIKEANKAGLDFIVCDHHLPDGELPPAVAILNPKQADCPYPYKELCGCGVGFKLISALAEKLNLDASMVNEWLDLVSIAIAADIVPITGENRLLTHFGLQKINENPSAGIKALMKVGGIDKKININNLVFVIAPRVNAAGRMDDARKAVQLFIEPDDEKALAIASVLHNDNDDRKEADLNITEEALMIIGSDETMISRKSTVVYKPHWHKGVVGIVASRLIERYYRPTIVLTQSGDIIAGSARSVAGFNLYEAIHACREHLLGYGGHFAAAGMSLKPDQLEAFANKFEDVVSSTIDPDLLIPELVIDAEVRFIDLGPRFYHTLCQMEPFGPENAKPVFVARRVEDYGWSKIVKDMHIRFVLRQEGTIFTGIGFNLAHLFPLMQMKSPLDIVFTLDENEWNGQKNLQLKIIDIRLSEN